LSVVARTPPPATGHSPNRAFFAWRSATRSGFRLPETPSSPASHARCLAGRRRSSLQLFVVRRRSWGSTRPSQICSLSRVDAPRLLRRDELEHTFPACLRLDISAGPGPRAVRASASAPIDFRRGDRSPVGVQRDLQKRSAGDADGVDFWASAPVCGPLTQRSFGRASDPALGFASCRVVGHVAVHRPGSTPIPITSLRSAGRTYPSPAIPIRSWTWRRSFPSHASVVISRGELPPWHVRRRVIAKY
jgi:hypothetical protein